MMQSTGDMKTPSALSALVCLLNVVLNRLMIFPASTVHGIPIPGAGLRVVGAAIATTLSEVIISLTALYLLATRNKRISLRNKGSWKWKRQNIENAEQADLAEKQRKLEMEAPKHRKRRPNWDSSIF